MKNDTMPQYLSGRPQNDSFRDILAKRRQAEFEANQRNIQRSQSQYQQQPQQMLQPQKQEEYKPNFLTRSLATVGDVVGNVATGLSKGVEGIMDFGAGIVGAVGGWVAPEFQNKVKDHISYDWTGTNIGNPLQELTKHSYTNDSKFGQMIEQVASGIGQMLPAVAVSFIPGGAASTAMFMTSAAGNATEEAFQTGADYGNGFAYGTMSGIVEGGIEKLTGGFGGTKSGMVLGKQIGKTTLGRLGVGFVGEGMEEVASDLINPALKHISGVDKEAKVDWGRLPETFLVGGGTGLAMGGSYRVANNIKNKNRGGANATKADETLNYIYENIDGMAKRKDLSVTERLGLDTSKREMLQNVSKYIEKMSEGERTSYLKSLEKSPIRLAFDDNGGVNFDTSKSSSFNQSAYSENIRGLENKLIFQPVGDTIEVDQHIGKIKSDIENILGDNANVVITDDSSFEGNAMFNLKDGVIYVSTNADINNANAGEMLAVHEVWHTLEGTKESAKLQKFLHETTTEMRDGNGDITNRFGGYETTFDNVAELYDNPNLSGKKQTFTNQTETSAKYLGSMLGNDYFIQKLANSHKNVARQIVASMRNLLYGKNKTKLNENLQIAKYLNKVYSKYKKALSASVGGFSLSNLDEDEEVSQNLPNFAPTKALQYSDEWAKIRESKKGSKKEKTAYWQFNELALRWAASAKKNELFAGYKNGVYEIVVATGDDNLYKNFKTIDADNTNVIEFYEEYINENNEQVDRVAKEVREIVDSIENAKGFYNRGGINVARGQSDIRNGELYQDESTNNGIRHTEKSPGDIRTLTAPEDIREAKKDKRNNKSYYNQYNTLAMQWAYSTSTKQGDMKFLYNPQYNTWDRIVADDTDYGYSVVSSIFDNGKNLDKINELVEEVNYEGNRGEQRENKRFFNSSERNISTKRHGSNDSVIASKRGRNEYGGGIYKEQPTSQRNGDSGQSPGDIRTLTDTYDIRFSKKSFTEQVDDVLSGKNVSNTHLKLLDKTPPILIRAGLPNLPILMTARHLKTVIFASGNENSNYHNLGIDIVKRLPNLISDPIIIMESLSKSDSHVVVTEVVDSENRPVIAAIAINGNGYSDYRWISANVLTSAYGRNNFQGLLNRSVKESKVIYINKEKSQYILSIPGLQLPNNIVNVGSNTSVRNNDGFVNKNIDEDERYSLKDKKYRLSEGQTKKILANYKMDKVYSKSEAERVINDILEATMEFENGQGTLSKKDKDEVIDKLWIGLNSAKIGERNRVALDIADYIINNTVMDAVLQDETNFVHAEAISILKPYLHKLDLSGIKDEIQHAYDKDNSPYIMWQAKQGEKGMSPDTIAHELSESGIFLKNDNPADIFFEIDTIYHEAVGALRKKSKQTLKNNISDSDLKELKNDLARAALTSYDTTGKKSKFSQIVEKCQNKADKKGFFDGIKQASTVNRLLYKIRKLEDKTTHKYLSATQYENDSITKAIHALTRITVRGNLNKSSTRDILKDFSRWYNKENPLLANDVFNQEIEAAITEIAIGSGSLSLSDMQTLENIIDHLRHLISTHNKIYQNGRYIEALPLAQNHVDIIRRNNAVKTSWGANLLRTVYVQVFGDPATVARRMDMYEDGFYTQSINAFRDGGKNAAITEMEMMKDIEDFFKNNKKYLQSQNDRTIDIDGIDVPISHAISLYMTSQREQAVAGLAQSGFQFTIKNKGKIQTYNIKGFAVNQTKEQQADALNLFQDNISKNFTDLDRQYIKIAEKLFNEDCKNLKAKTDMLRQGFTNTIGGYYMPIRRANISKSIDLPYMEEMKLADPSFNKNTVKGAKNELQIDHVHNILTAHVNAMAKYANLSIVIDNYNRVFNMDVGGNANKITNVKTESLNGWKEGEKYFTELLDDIKGISRQGVGNKTLGNIRKNYAVFQLALNAKVLVTQTSSFFASLSILDFNSIIKGMTIKGNDVDKYCKLAQLRNHENTAAMAQGVFESVGKVGDFLMKPIGMMDRFVVEKLFSACQVQVQKKDGLKVGAEENLIKAGKLLETVIFETQQNSLLSERTAAMRSDNELLKSLTMFSADSVKVLGRVFDSFGEYMVLKRRITSNDGKVSELNERLKSAKKKVKKSVTALASSAIFMAMVAQLFRFLYNKDKDEKDVVKTMAVDALGNIMGGLPLFNDLYAKLVDGYDIDNYAFSTINNLLNSASGIYDTIGDFITGKGDEKDLAKNARSVLYSSGQLLGIPTRNLYNMGYGVTSRLSPSTAYQVENAFYDKNYQKDIKKALERGDEKTLSAVAELMLNDIIGKANSVVKTEIVSLLSEGQNITPKKIGDKLTHNNEIIVLNKGQKNVFKNSYSTANTTVSTLIGSSEYAKADMEIKANAIKFVFDTQYELAKETVTGEKLSTKNTLIAAAIPLDKLAIIIARAKQITAETVGVSKKAKLQGYINAQRLTATQKYILMGYLGYKNTHGNTKVKSYIQTLPLTKMQKESLFAISGY